MATIFSDSPHYQKRKQTPFAPPEVTLAEIHASIPKHLFEKSTLKGLFYYARDFLLCALFYYLATHIEPLTSVLVGQHIVSFRAGQVLKWVLWSTYWWFQGLMLTGCWCLGHEAGHGTLSQYRWVNHVMGYTLQTPLLVPYFALRSSHHAHHKTTSWVEKDETYVPRTRADYNLPSVSVAHIRDYHDMFEETPIYTLGRMLIMQFLGFQLYLTTNALGSPRYPEGTNHFNPDSALFKPHERNKMIASNVGVAVMCALLSCYISKAGWAAFIKFYVVPYFLANHWIVMLTYLHHSDPTIPHYRTKEWSFVRGAAATVDRPLLGWMGRFFLHNMSHDHVAHHFFSMIPFYNQPEATEHIKSVLKEHYNYDDTNTFRALYRSFTQCCFIEDDGDIVFYKNQHGQAQRSMKVAVDGEGAMGDAEAISEKADM